MFPTCMEHTTTSVTLAIVESEVGSTGGSLEFACKLTGSANILVLKGQVNP